jgi:hypothetical protein
VSVIDFGATLRIRLGRLTRLGAIMLGMREHIAAKMAAAEIVTSPTPHLIIENFFPDDVYAKLLEYNPFASNRGVEWMTKNESRNVSSRTPYYARKQINFQDNQPFDAPEEQQLFWEELKGCFLGDDWFPQLIIDKYPMYFDIRFGDAMREGDFISQFRRELFLQRHEPGYYIGPHTDIPTRVFTCIFSLADRPGYEEYGTEFVVPKNRMARCWGNDHYSPDDFEVKVVAPYKPNNFMIFFKTRHAFHSVKAIPEDVPNQRYGMQFQFYEAGNGIFQDLSVPDLLDVVRRNPGQQTLKSKVKSLIGRG